MPILINKDLRLLLVFQIYENLYFESMFSPEDNKEKLFLNLNRNEKDLWTTILDQKNIKKNKTISIEDENSVIDFGLFKKYIEKLDPSRENIIEKIQKHTKSWGKTSILTKSILIAYLLELEILKNEIGLENILPAYFKTIITSYLRICDDFDSKETVSAVHALLVKLEKDIKEMVIKEMDAIEK